DVQLRVVQDEDGAFGADRDLRHGAAGVRGLDPCRGECCGLTGSEDPDAAVRGGDGHAVPAERDLGAGWEFDQSAAAHGGRVDRGHAARAGLDDVVAGLEDVEVIAGHGQSRVELLSVHVQTAQQPAALVQDPDAPVGDLDLGGGESVEV